MTVLVRAARETDVPAIAAIYAVEVREDVNTYEYEVPDEAEMLRRLRTVLAAGYPYLVAESGGTVLGYAYASSFRGRTAYQWVVENSVYVAHGQHGKGIGTTLMERLIAACEARGYRQMVAVIGTPDNAASIRLHARFGFTHLANFPAIAWKHGRWLDTVFMQRALGPGASEPPAELEHIEMKHHD